MKDGYYGIVSKRFQQDSNYESSHEEPQNQMIRNESQGQGLPSHKFKDHYSVGVIVKIIDQQ